MFYRTFDLTGIEKIKLTKMPTSVLLDYQKIKEQKTGEGFEWIPYQKGGVLIVRRLQGRKVLLLK